MMTQPRLDCGLERVHVINRLTCQLSFHVHCQVNAKDCKTQITTKLAECDKRHLLTQCKYNIIGSNFDRHTKNLIYYHNTRPSRHCVK